MSLKIRALTAGAWEQAAIGEAVSEWKERAALESADAREEAQGTPTHAREEAAAVGSSHETGSGAAGGVGLVAAAKGALEAVEDNYSRYAPKERQVFQDFPAEASRLVATKRAILDGTQARPCTLNPRPYILHPQP